MQSLKEEHIPYRVAEWLPSDHAHLKRWLDGMIQKTDAHSRVLHPVIADFQHLIESDPEVFMLFNQMFEQVPKRAPYYGGSTHCLIFRPGVRLEFDHHGQKPGLHAQPIPVNTRIARLVK
jgi:hypothetical protein